MKYLANFALEFNGKSYDPEDVIGSSKLNDEEQNALDSLVKAGRVTVLEDGDEEVAAVASSKSSK